MPVNGFSSIFTTDGEPFTMGNNRWVDWQAIQEFQRELRLVQASERFEPINPPLCFRCNDALLNDRCVNEFCIPSEDTMQDSLWYTDLFNTINRMRTLNGSTLWQNVH